MSRLDPTSFTTPHMLMEMLHTPGNILIQRGDPGEVRVYTAIATTDAVTISTDALKKLIKGNLSTEEHSVARWQVMCKIVGNAQGISLTGAEIAHNFLPLSGEGITEEIRAGLISGTLIRGITGKDFAITKATPILEDYRIKISVTFDQEGFIDLSLGEILSVSETLVPGPKSIFSLSGLFGMG